MCRSELSDLELELLDLELEVSVKPQLSRSQYGVWGVGGVCRPMCAVECGKSFRASQMSVREVCIQRWQGCY